MIWLVVIALAGLYLLLRLVQMVHFFVNDFLGSGFAFEPSFQPFNDGRRSERNPFHPWGFSI